MSGHAITPEDGLAVWQRIAAGTPAASAGALSPAAVERLAELASPVLADHLLGGGVLDPGAIQQSRLNNRYRLAAQRACLAEIATTEIPVVVIKGFALAYTIYDDPELRAVGDIDLLVRSEDRDRLITHLTGQGYTFEPLPRPAWGFISEASYAPFVSPDEGCNLDVHIHPDCYPAYRSLTTERVFESAVPLASGDVPFCAACSEHAFLLCATNVAKDKFGPFATRKIADAMRLAKSGGLDWPSLDRLASEGGYRTPYRVFVKLLLDLGLEASHLPPEAGRDLPSRIHREYARMLEDTQRLYPGEPGLAATLRRELLLSTEPPVGARNAWSRLKGLVRRDDGIPRVSDAA